MYYAVASMSAPSAGLEPTHMAPEANALSTELRGQFTTSYCVVHPFAYFPLWLACRRTNLKNCQNSAQSTRLKFSAQNNKKAHCFQ